MKYNLDKEGRTPQREREREREREYVCVCVWVCMRVSGKEIRMDKSMERNLNVKIRIFCKRIGLSLVVGLGLTELGTGLG